MKEKISATLNIDCDTETYKTQKVVDGIAYDIVLPHLIGWCDDGSFKKTFYWSKEPHTKFFDYLKKKYKDYKKIVIWFHNAKYDMLVLHAPYLDSMATTFNFQVGEKGKFIKYSFRGPDFTFKVKDTLKWNYQSLASYIKLLKLPSKLSIPYDKTDCVFKDDHFEFKDKTGQLKTVSLKEELDYLKNDVLAISHIREYIQDLKNKGYKALGINKNDKHPKHWRDPQTSPSYGKFVLNWLLSNKFDGIFRPLCSSIESYQEQQNSSIGGFTSFNKTMTNVNLDSPLIKSYDINSSYPYTMSEYMPYGRIFSSTKQLKNPITWYYCTISHIQWKPKYDCIFKQLLPKKVLGKKFYLCQKYYDLIIENTINDLTIIKTVYQESAPFLSKPMELLYSKKAEAKGVDPELEKNLKLIINSAYGKLLEKAYFKKITYQDNRFITEHLTELTLRGCLSGVYVAQMGRYNLISILLAEMDQGNIFLHCDTDSIKMIEYKKPLFTADSHKLGHWKYEGEYHIFMHNLKDKKYYLFNKDNPEHKPKLALSGVNNKVAQKMMEKLTHEDYEILFNYKNNVLIKNGKNINKKTELWNQILIESVDFEFNNTFLDTNLLIKPTHILDIDKDEDYLIKIDG